MQGIKKITFGTIGAGPLNGGLAYHVTLSGEEGMDGNSLLKVIRDFKGGPNKLVYFLGEINPKNDDILRTIVKALKDNQYKTIIETDGQIWMTWMMYVDYIIVNLKEVAWPGFQVNEIRYHPQDPRERIEEPVLPASKEDVRLLLDAPDAPPKVLLEFLRGSMFKWGIYSLVAKGFSAILYDEEVK